MNQIFKRRQGLVVTTRHVQFLKRLKVAALLLYGKWQIFSCVIHVIYLIKIMSFYIFVTEYFLFDYSRYLENYGSFKKEFTDL